MQHWGTLQHCSYRLLHSCQTSQSHPNSPRARPPSPTQSCHTRGGPPQMLASKTTARPTCVSTRPSMVCNSSPKESDGVPHLMNETLKEKETEMVNETEMHDSCQQECSKMMKLDDETRQGDRRTMIHCQCCQHPAAVRRMVDDSRGRRMRWKWREWRW